MQINEQINKCLEYTFITSNIEIAGKKKRQKIKVSVGVINTKAIRIWSSLKVGLNVARCLTDS